MATNTTRTIVSLLCIALCAPGCAASRGGVTVAPAAGASAAERSILAEYVQRLPAGSAVRVGRSNGRTLRGTLMKATERSLIVQPRTRVPEPPVEVLLDDVISITPETPGNNQVGRAIAIGAAAGAGAALAVFFIILAVLSD